MQFPGIGHLAIHSSAHVEMCRIMSITDAGWQEVLVHQYRQIHWEP